MIRLILSFLCPPLAILICGRPFQALICAPLCLFYFPAVLWALLVVSDYLAWQNEGVIYRSLERAANAELKAINRMAKTIDRAGKTEVKLAKLSLEKAKVQAAAMAVPNSPVPISAYHPNPPKKLTLNDFFSSMRDVKERAVLAYQNLPEWAQPITWGLAAATPISFAMAAFFVTS